MTIYVLSCKQNKELFKAVWWWEEFPQFGMVSDALTSLLIEGVSNVEVTSLLENDRLIIGRGGNSYLFILEEKEEGLL